jgi:hypothetical protein
MIIAIIAIIYAENNKCNNSIATSAILAAIIVFLEIMQ